MNIGKYKSWEKEESSLEQINRVFKQVNNSNSITIWNLLA